MQKPEVQHAIQNQSKQTNASDANLRNPKVQQAIRNSPERWMLIFEAAGNGPPMAVRVRRLLKAAGRCYGLRCVVAEEKKEQHLDSADAVVHN